MKALIVSCVYPPEPVVSAQTSAQIAAALASQGNEVTVITNFPNRPAGKIASGYHRRLYQAETPAPNYRIVRCFTTVAPRSGMLSRLAENLSFGITSGLAVLFGKRPDVIYANTWPIFAQGLLSLVAHARRVPLVLSIQDIYPESLIAQQRIKPTSRIARALHWLDRRIVRGCAAVVVISQRFAEVYATSRDVPRDRLHVVPNWIDENSVTPGEKMNDIRRRYGIPEHAFVMAYGGNIGMASGIETVIEACGLLCEDERIYLLVAGAGSQLAACRDRAARLSNPRIVFHTPWLAGETSEVLAAADALVLPTRGSQSLASVPSKLITYMLAERPVLALALPDSDVEATIREADCGWVIAPDEPMRLAATIREIASLDPLETRRLAADGRAYALQKLTRAANVRRVVEILERTGGRAVSSCRRGSNEPEIT